MQTANWRNWSQIKIFESSTGESQSSFKRTKTEGEGECVCSEKRQQLKHTENLCFGLRVSTTVKRLEQAQHTTESTL
ncbi:4272_t:CDS:2, partial [Gigaspora rosea]